MNNRKKNKYLARRLTAAVLTIALTLIGINISSAPLETSAASYQDISFISANDATAKKVHKALMTGKKIELPDYGNGDFERLMKRITRDYAYGVTFERKYHSESKDGVIFYTSKSKAYPKNDPMYGSGYTVYVISAKQAARYRDFVNERKNAVRTKTPYSKATDALAQDIHESLMAKKAYTFYVNGSPKTFCNSLKKKMRKLNNQDVIFKYTSTKQSGSVYQVVIDQVQAEAYCYAVLFSEKICKNAKQDLLDEIQSDAEFLAKRYPEQSYEEWYAYCYDDLSYIQTVLLDTNCMRDVSSINKLRILFKQTDIFYRYRSETIMGEKIYIASTGGIAYSADNKTSIKKESTILKNLYYGTARGDSYEFAYSAKVLLSYWGIKVNSYNDGGAGEFGSVGGFTTDETGKEYEYYFDGSQFWSYSE